MSGDVLLFHSGTWRAEERGKRLGIVASMEKLGRRRKLEVRGGFSHHLAAINIQKYRYRNGGSPLNS